jgi:Cys-tRNA(Pro)/Cys-tRNA(Cys) deacylase
VATVNNITRMLEAKKIPFTTFETPVEKLGAVETAHFLDVPLERVYKTVVVTRHYSSGTPSTAKGKPILAVAPGTNTVDLKLLANVLGEKKVFLPTEREAELLTGLQAGGISPLALINKGFQVIIDEAAQTLDSIHISGGQRGLNILLPVDALVKLTRARFAKISIPGK